MQQLNVKKVIQTSPAAHAQLRTSTKWDVINGMETAVEFASTEVELARKQLLGIADVSCLARYGVKGPSAMQWLVNHGVVIPTSVNAWLMTEQKTLVLRLGTSEFLIEDQLDGFVCNQLANEVARVAGVYQVPRADAAFVISGSETQNLLSELCSLDLREKSFTDHQLIMTQIAGISATLINQIVDGESVYRIWCDGTYGAYLWEILIEVAAELGGGAVGLSHFQG